jgi:hypothetical protein
MKPSASGRRPERRYAAKLLFQFRVAVGRVSGVRRFCEERILSLTARTARRALASAKRLGKAAEYHYENSDGNPVFFEFIGVMDLLHLGLECQEVEVWYEIKERIAPMERRNRFIPPETELSAIRNDDAR